MIATLLVVVQASPASASSHIFINEIHYDNAGADTGEFVEVAGPAGTNLSGWTIALYNGNGGGNNATINLVGTIPDQDDGFGTLSFSRSGIQNGSPDGMALVDPGANVLEFISYEGSFVATDGPAVGLSSTDIGVSEPNTTPIGESIFLTGTGAFAADFSWTGPELQSPNEVNPGQDFIGGGGSPLVVDCGPALVVTEGESGTTNITASDGDDTIAAMTVIADTVTPAGSLTETVNPGDPASLTVNLAIGADVGSFTATIEATNGSGDTATCDLTIIVEAPVAVVSIHEIQGNGQFSPLLGQTVETSGVVTLIDASGTDAWIQTPDAAVDADPTTSEGIFIDDFQFLDGSPEIGDFITVQGEVEEQGFGNALPRTRLDDTVLIANNGQGETVTPLALTDLPNDLLSDGITFWEALEGMLVQAENGTVVAPTSGFGEFGFLLPADTAPGSGYFSSINQIILRDLGGNEVDYNPERILVDDDAAPTPDVSPGDTVDSLLGVVDYTFGAFKLQLRELSVSTNAIPTSPVAERDSDTSDDDGKQRAVITTYNVQNLFDLFLNPNKGNQDAGSTPSAADLETQLTKLALSIEAELLLPEIMVLQEVENTFIAQELGNRVNASAGTNYIATSFETSDARGIEVAFLWDADRVSLLETFQLSGDDVEAAYGPASASPGREPLYGKFQIGGDVVHIVGNHFKSKGGDDPPFGLNDPFIRITEVQRKLQAQVVRDFVDTIFDADGDALVMVTGDLNDFPFGEPGEGTDHPVAIVAGADGINPLSNLIFEEPADEQWSFIFDGNSQVLDHMLVSDSLGEKMVGADFLQFNARYPAGLGDDASTAVRASDHDPFEGRFLFEEGEDEPDDKPNNRNAEARFATYNASLNRFNAGDLIDDLSGPNDVQAAAVAEIIQRTRPDVLLVNEFDFDAGGVAAGLFQDNVPVGVARWSVAHPLPVPVRGAFEHWHRLWIRPRQQRFVLAKPTMRSGSGSSKASSLWPSIRCIRSTRTTSGRSRTFYGRTCPGTLIPAGFLLD